MIDKDKLLANPSAPSNTPIVGNFFLKANRKLVSIHSLLKGSVALKKIQKKEKKRKKKKIIRDRKLRIDLKNVRVIVIKNH